MNLSGKVAVITGSASGIGKATMLAFAQAGAHVISADIDDDKNAAAVKELTAQKLSAEPGEVNADPEGAAWFFKMKISDKTEFDALMTRQQYDAFVEGQ